MVASVTVRLLTENDAALLSRVAPDVLVLTEEDNLADRKLYSAVAGCEQSMVYVTFELGGEERNEPSS